MVWKKKPLWIKKEMYGQQQRVEMSMENEPLCGSTAKR